MQPPSTTNPPKPSALFKLGCLSTLAGAAVLILVEYVIARVESLLSTGVHIDTDPFTLLFTFVLACLALFIPVFLGVFLLSALLRYLLRKGRLTPVTGLLSGMGLWTLGGILFCLLFMAFDPFPVGPALQPRDLWGMFPLLLNDVFLPGIVIACLAGGWAGHVLAGQLLSGDYHPPAAG